MNYFNKKMDKYHTYSRFSIIAMLLFIYCFNTSAQSLENSCYTIPFTSNVLIKVSKTDGSETVIGGLGVKRVQALAISPFADTIFAARSGELGVLTPSATRYKKLPLPFGTGDGVLGSLEFVEVEGLSFDLCDNTMFASVKIEEPSKDVLIKVNPKTGAHIPDAFGPGVDYVVIDGPGVFSIVEDIAVSPITFEMYGLAREEDGNDVLIKINKEDGSATVIGPVGIDIVEGMGFDNQGDLYATPGLKSTAPPRFFRMDLSTGAANTIGLLSSEDYEACDCLDIADNSAPVANDDIFNIIKDSTTLIDPPGVLANDSDPDGDIVTIQKFDSTTAQGVEVILNPDGSFTYDPIDDFTGVDTFTYTVKDGKGRFDSATVTILVKDPVNQDPNALDDNYSTEVDVPLVIEAPGVLANDIDPDGDELEIIDFDSNTQQGGTVALDNDGGFTYTPPAGFEGSDEFSYVISDGAGGTDTAQVFIEVILGATDPVANDDVYSTDQNTELVIEAPGVLGNDTDPNGDVLTVVDYDEMGIKGGQVQMNPDGSFTFTPVTDLIETDEFTYVVSDPDGNTDTATVFININDPRIGGNRPPIAENDTLMTDQDVELIITDPEEGLLVNDSDPDGDNIAALVVTNAITDQGGSISINEDGTFTYVPPIGFVGVDTYEYTICDDGEPELCDTGIIVIEVKEIPVKVFDAYSPNGDGRNDLWVIQGITRFPNNKVQIFNRWGNLVFKTVGYDNTARVWQGQSTEGLVLGSNNVPDGAYYYIIELGDGSRRLSGYVVIQR